MRSAVEQTSAVEELEALDRRGAAEAAPQPAEAGPRGFEAGRRRNGGGGAADGGPQGAGGSTAPAESPSRGLRRPAVSPWLRGALLALGGVLLAVGVAGLVLPGIQGLVTILAGLVVVSMASHAAHRRMRRGLRRWPRALDLYQRMRRSLHRRFSRRRR